MQGTWKDKIVIFKWTELYFCIRELSFQAGDIIFVRRQIDKNWYEGEHNAMIGIFPVNYVEVVVMIS